MAGDQKFRQQRTQRRKRNKNVPVGLRKKPPSSSELTRHREFMKYHDKKAYKMGLTRNAKHYDGKTPHFENQSVKNTVRADRSATNLKVFLATEKDDMVEQMEQGIRTEYRHYQAQQRQKIKDLEKMYLDTHDFLVAEQKTILYTRAKINLYKAEVDKFQTNLINNFRKREEKEINKIGPVLNKISAQNVKQNYISEKKQKLQAIASRNKFLRTYREQLLYPKHSVITAPKLTATMNDLRVINWEKRVGDRINLGDVLCHVKTDRNTIDSIESTEEGYLAKVLAPAIGKGRGNTQNDGKDDGKSNFSSVLVGRPIAIIVSKLKDIQRFNNLNLDKNEQKLDINGEGKHISQVTSILRKNEKNQNIDQNNFPQNKSELSTNQTPRRNLDNISDFELLELLRNDKGISLDNLNQQQNDQKSINFQNDQKLMLSKMDPKSREYGTRLAHLINSAEIAQSKLDSIDVTDSTHISGEKFSSKNNENNYGNNNQNINTKNQNNLETFNENFSQLTSSPLKKSNLITPTNNLISPNTTNRLHIQKSPQKYIPFLGQNFLNKIFTNFSNLKINNLLFYDDFNSELDYLLKIAQDEANRDTNSFEHSNTEMRGAYVDFSVAPQTQL